MRNVMLAGVIGSIMVGVYAMGYFSGKNAVKLDDFKEYKTAVEARDVLQEKLNASDVELQKKQQELKEARSKKVVEKVIVYRDRIKDSATAQCVKDSGILDLYDATVK
nr:MAG TPA: coiled-coil domain-containing protein [Caudoviricetes sp.]